MFKKEKYLIWTRFWTIFFFWLLKEKAFKRTKPKKWANVLIWRLLLLNRVQPSQTCWILIEDYYLYFWSWFHNDTWENWQVIAPLCFCRFCHKKQAWERAVIKDVALRKLREQLCAPYVLHHDVLQPTSSCKIGNVWDLGMEMRIQFWCKMSDGLPALPVVCVCVSLDLSELSVPEYPIPPGFIPPLFSCLLHPTAFLVPITPSFNSLPFY